MPEADVEILNTYGFHVRPSTSFAQLAMPFSCDVFVSLGGREVDGKSPMQLMTLGGKCGEVVTVRTEGDGSEEALQQLVEHINSRFGGMD